MIKGRTRVVPEHGSLPKKVRKRENNPPLWSQIFPRRWPSPAAANRGRPEDRCGIDLEPVAMFLVET